MTVHALKTIGGEFACPDREARFRNERLPETIRHGRLLFAASALLNALFLVSDWRFFGEPHFWLAVPARLTVVAASLACFAVIRRAGTFQAAQRTMVAWEGVTALAVALLVSSRSEIALIAALMLPAIYFLVVPTSFRWTLVAGGGCAGLMMAGYMLPPPAPPTAPGLLLGTLTFNTALILVVVRSNRLRRLEWAAVEAERHANLELAQSRRLVESVFRAVPIPLIVRPVNKAEIIHANDAALEYFGGDVPSPDKALADVQVPRADRAALFKALSRDGRISDFETTVRLADGSARNVLVSAATVVAGDQTQVVAGIVDITSRKAAEDRVWRAAHHDALTGLPNRALFQSRLETLLASAERSDRAVGLILLDLDTFKEINDTLGHDAGDAVLRTVADRLSGVAGEDYFVARLGGDEFVLVIPGPANGPAAIVLLEMVGQAVLEVLRAPLPLRDRVVSPRGALGLASYPEHATTPADLLKNADLALYAAKTKGRNRAVLFAPAMRASVERRVEIARQVRGAIADGMLVPYYQPKMRLETNEVVGFEALARWLHPTKGLLSPEAFATAFEDRDIAIALGERILRGRRRPRRMDRARLGAGPRSRQLGFGSVRAVRPRRTHPRHSRGRPRSAEPPHDRGDGDRPARQVGRPGRVRARSASRRRTAHRP
jgi:diguanylate cyclase (GGDEF)-like protein